MTVEYDESALTAPAICAAVQEIGYGASDAEAPSPGAQAQASSGFREEWQSRQQRAEDDQASMKSRLISSIILLIPLMYVAMGGMMGLPMPAFLTGTENALISALTQLVITVPVILINRKFYIVGFKALAHRAPNMDSLVAVGSSASLLYGIFAMYRMAYGFGHGDMAVVHEYAHALYFESAAMILTLVTVGKYLEARSKSKTSDALGKLVDLAPKTAVVVRDGVEVTVPAEQVVAGDVVVIKPGESIPVDGEVIEGFGYVDQAAITGESIPWKSALATRSSPPPSTKTAPSLPRLARGQRYHARADHPPRGRRQLFQSAHRPPRRQGQRRVRARGHGHRACDRHHLDGRRLRLRVRPLQRHLRAGHLLPLRAGPGHARGYHGRHRQGR